MESISLVIPATPGDAIFLPELLRAINQGTLLPNEIIISISSAGDMPKALIEDIENAFGNVSKGSILLNREMLLASGNRNKGSALASSDIVAFFDADDLPHPQLFQTVAFLFANRDIVHLNHRCTRDVLNTVPIEKIVTIDSDILYPLYFPEGKFEDCVLHAGAYGINLPAPFTDVVTGHTYVRREVLEQVRFRDPDDKPFRKAEDYIFCMETLFKFRKSAIIDSVLSFYRPSAERGQNRHGYKNVTYVSV